MVRFGRVDGNQSEIIRLSRQIPGLSVKVLSDVGDGFTDTIYGYMGVNYLIEIKNGSKLTQDQEDFHGVSENTGKEWKGQKDIAHSFEDVCQIIGVKMF